MVRLIILSIIVAASYCKTSVGQTPEVFHSDFPSVVIAEEPTSSPTAELLLPTTIPLVIPFAMTTSQGVMGMGEAVIRGMGMGEMVGGGMGMGEAVNGGMAMGEKVEKGMGMGEKEVKIMGMGEMTMVDMSDKRSERYLRTSA
jgi:hypothetical protein